MRIQQNLKVITIDKGDLYDKYKTAFDSGSLPVTMENVRILIPLSVKMELRSADMVIYRHKGENHIIKSRL